MDLKGKSAIVTGAARGIGRGIALKLAAAGANIALVDLGNPADKALTYDLAAQTELLKTAEEVKALGVKAITDIWPMSPNLPIASAWRRRLQGPLAAIDVLAANAGIIALGLVADFPEEQWDRVMEVNAKGPFLCAKAVIPYHDEAERGRDYQYGLDCRQAWPCRSVGLLRQQIRRNRSDPVIGGRTWPGEYSRQRGLSWLPAHRDVDRGAQ